MAFSKDSAVESDMTYCCRCPPTALFKEKKDCIARLAEAPALTTAQLRSEITTLKRKISSHEENKQIILKNAAFFYPSINVKIQVGDDRVAGYRHVIAEKEKELNKRLRGFVC